MRLRSWAVTFGALASAITFGQTSYVPTPVELRLNYKAANELGAGLNERHINLEVRVVWSPESGYFIYRREKLDRKAEYVIVPTKTGNPGVAFDHVRLAAGLSKAVGRTLDAETLNFTVTALPENLESLSIRQGDTNYRVDLKTYEVTKLESETTRRTNPAVPQPEARIRDGKLEVRPKPDAEFEVISTVPDITRMHRIPAGTHAVAFRQFQGDRKPVYLLKSSVNETTRAALEQRLYDQPGDKTDTFDVYVYDLMNRTEKRLDIDPIFGGGQPWAGPPQVQFWGDQCIVSYSVRGYQEHRVVSIDPSTGTHKLLIHEKSRTFIDQSKTRLQVLQGGKELIWPSERSGWNHLYLYDRTSDSLKAITSGNWVVRNIQHVDEQRRQIWFSASGFGDPSKDDPYHIRFCRINFDGTGFIDLTPGEGTHTVQFSPDRSFYVDSYSRVDKPPVHELRRSADGTLVRLFERGRIPMNYLKVTRFVAKGRDGKTDIWGIMIRPTHLKKGLRYPVIENIYAGPHDSFVPKAYRPMNNMHRLAELGFIVVQIDGMGTNNRGKAFHDVAWRNIVDAGFPDRIAWIKALSAKHAEVDINRVGIYGTSAGGQNSAGALLFHPDFYDVAVSSCGCHDNRIDKLWWNEQWMGYPVGPHYDAQSNITHAKNLRGKLLLFVGEQDRNVPPESTIRFADALIKAGKNFDMLIIPGADHTDGGVYGERRRRDYFVRWLHGVEPPDWNEVASGR